MAREAWGKTDGPEGPVHPLAHHTMDVAAVFQRLISLPVFKVRLATAAGTPLTAADCTRLSALGFLHDIGKLHRGFQAKGWLAELSHEPKRGHLAEGWAFVVLAHKWPEHPGNDPAGADEGISGGVAGEVTPRA